MDRSGAFVHFGCFRLFFHFQFQVDVTGRHVFFSLVFAEEAELELTSVRHIQTIYVLFQFASGESLVVIRSHYIVIGIQNIHTHDAQSAMSALVKELGGECSWFFYFQIQDDILYIVTIETQFVDTFRNVGQSFPIGRIPGAGQYFVGTNLVLPSHIHFSGLDRCPVVVTCLDISSGVDARRSFQPGKDTVAGNHGTTGIAHYFGHSLSVQIVHNINHRYDGMHRYVLIGSDVHFGTEVVRTVTQHGTPGDVQVFVFKFRFDGLPVETFGTLHGIFVAFQFQRTYFVQLHFRCQHLGTVAQADFEDFRTG